MRVTNRTNSKVIESFKKCLDDFEASTPKSSVEYAFNKIPEKNINMALDRLLSSNPNDTLSMLRILVDRIIMFKDTSYSYSAMSSIVSGTSSIVLKNYINSIIVYIKKLLDGGDVNHDIAWCDKIKYNTTVEKFIYNLKLSDQYFIYNTKKENIITQSDFLNKEMVSTSTLEIKMGICNKYISIQSTDIPEISMVLDDLFEYPEGYEDSDPLIVRGEVAIEPSVGYLWISKDIKFSPAGLLAANELQCFPLEYYPNAKNKILLPDKFYSIKLYVTSIDSGVSWSIHGIDVLPPMRSK